MTVSWGVLSTARINERILDGARVADNVEVVAVASRDLVRSQAYAREHGIVHAHGSYEELLADPDVQAVYISLPNSLHVEWSIRALQAGKHVLCEKPLSCRAADVARAFDAADAAGRLLMEAFMWRHSPQTDRIRELVAQGAVGRLRMLCSSFSRSVEDPDDVRLSGPLDGGGLMDMGCYCVSALRLLAGEPRRVHAEAVTGGEGVDVWLSGALRFEDDVLAHFDCGVALPDRAGLEIVGDEGSLYVPDPFHPAHGGIVVRRGTTGEHVQVPPRDSYALQLADMSAAIEGHGTPRLGRADAIGQARTIEALLLSAREGRAIDLA